MCSGDVNVSPSESINPTSTSHSKAPIITCECGYQMRLLSDANAMVRAIENHLLAHAKTKTNRQKRTKEVNRMADALIEQVVKEASLSKNPLTVY